MKWRSLSLALPSFVLFLATEAGAQSDEQRAGARAAAQAGGQAFGDKRYSEAVDFFVRAESMLHSPVHLLYMARSHEKLGHLVKARETYIKINNDDLPAGAPGPWKEAHADADKELDALEPRIPYVTVTVQGAGSGSVTVTMDGAQVPSALLGVPRPVDPGDHRFEARADGMGVTTNTVSVKERRNENIVLTLVPAGSAPPPPPPVKAQPVQTAPPPAAPPPAAAPAAPGEAPPSSGAVSTSSASADSYAAHGPSPLSYVFVGAGLVGLGVGTVFIFKSNSTVKEANDICTGPNGDCPVGRQAEVNGLDDDARSQRKIGTIGLAAGGGLIALGAILFATTSKKKQATAELHPWVGLGSAGMSGRF